MFILLEPSYETGMGWDGDRYFVNTLSGIFNTFEETEKNLAETTHNWEDYYIFPCSKGDLAIPKVQGKNFWAVSKKWNTNPQFREFCESEEPIIGYIIEI